MRSRLRFLMLVTTLFSIALIGFFGAWVKFLYTPLITDEHGMRYTVREGSSIHAVIDDLYIRNILAHPLFFKWYVRIKGVANELKAGEYFFPYESTPPKILKQIITGSGLVYQAFTIVPGWTFKEIRNALQRNVYLHHTLQKATDMDIMTKLGHPELPPEGEFFPDTYYFAQGSDDSVILKHSFKDMQTKLIGAWKNRAPGLPFKTPYEALIGASIIEKEAFIEDELPTIAGVMVNRLRKGMLLQFDPTVLYGLERMDRTIHRTDLHSKSAYNTYAHKGLPPTPISMPSMAAIQAVMHPAVHDYYYFVAQGNGSSQFTKKLSEHYKAVAFARTTRWFFNAPLARYYLLKLFSQPIYEVR